MIRTLLVPVSARPTSATPSPVKSAAARPSGSEPTLICVARSKLPSPRPEKASMRPGVEVLPLTGLVKNDTAKSMLPSRLKSAAAM